MNYEQIAKAKKATLFLKKADILFQVESETDKIFWTKVLNYCNFSKKFHIDYYSKENEEDSSEKENKGKAQALKYWKYCDEKLKICVDSDYDFLLETGHLKNSNEILRSDFNIQNHILQTYTHSIENYNCYSNSLEKLCLTSTKSTENSIFDFEKFLKEYSVTIYPLFILFLLFEESEKVKFEQIDFTNAIKIDFRLVKIGDIFSKLSSLKTKVQSKLEELKSEFSEADFNKMKTQIEQKGVSEENCYLFIQGHFLFDRIVKPIVKNVTTQLSSEFGESMERLDKQNYFDNLKEAQEMLFSNYNFYETNIFQNVKNDVAALERKLI